MGARSRSMRLGVGLLAGAGALAVAAVLLRDPAPQPIAFVQPARIETPPPTVATLPPPTMPSTTMPLTQVSTRPTGERHDEQAPPTTLPISPLAAELPARRSAAVARSEPAAPTELWIGDVSLWAPIVPVGFEPDGELAVPDEAHVGWYRFGSSPGHAGSTVLAAHVSWHQTIGPFFRLGELDPGALIKLVLTDGTTRQYQVVERAQYRKTALPSDRIWNRSGDETLVLITCGGEFNRQIRHYKDNIVVYAVPISG